RAYLEASADRRPTVDEITGAARSMRAHMLPVEAPADAIDLCGTGGDGHGTLNISTAVSFVVAGAGVAVAKHGNRAASSKSGAADILEALGVKIGLAPDAASKVLAKTGIVFLFAQTHHPAMKYVGPVRALIKRRTIFNLLGPLSNPAGVTRQLTGVFAPEWLTPYAEALKALGGTRALVVHGRDRMDEITSTDATDAASLEGGMISRLELSPEQAGLTRTALADLIGGNAAENAKRLTGLLEGQQSAYRDIVLLNAAAALMVAGRANDIMAGMALASRALDSGAAKAKLAELIKASNA
ncbi:MAG TPA: anthranilate phosphoribosyltransferase, partial [Rhizomicrobium sp.]|nr:anthranilate phosphoribosyltransferase [Rhizomicrobium sp.]